MRRYLLALPFAAASSLFTAIPFALAQDEEQGERPARPAPPAWLAALDVDGNGEISAAELAKASESLGKLDANDDGVLQMNELQPRPNRRGPGGPRGPRGPLESQAGGKAWNGPEYAGRDLPGRGPWMGRPDGPGRDEGHGPGMRRGPGGPGMEGRGPEGRGPEGRGPGMRRGPGGPGMEGRGPEGRGPGMRRGPGGPGMEGRGPEGRGPGMRRGPGGPGMEGRGPEGRGPGMRRGPGGPGMEGRGPEGRGPEKRGPIPPPRFEDVDANQDGVIDREEFDKAVRAMHRGGPPRELGDDNRGPRAERGPGRGAGERPRRDRAPQQPSADSPIELDAEQNDVA